jgi:hypothetical protein
MFEKLSQIDRGRLAGVIRRLSALGDEYFEITIENIASLVSQAPKANDVSACARAFLRAIAERSPFAGAVAEFDFDVDRPLAFATTRSQLQYLCNYLCDNTWIAITFPGNTDALTPLALRNIWQRTPQSDLRFMLTPAGWEIAQQRPRVDSDKAFVAMWFDPAVQDGFAHGIYPAIRNDCGFRPVRIDAEEYNGDIVDQVLAEIRESRFVVADLTGHRNGVYFEAGFAMGLDIPVIWTCKSDEGRGTHFDAEHFNQIRWDTPEDLRKKLQARIRATIGRGPLAPETLVES